MRKNFEGQLKRLFSGALVSRLTSHVQLFEHSTLSPVFNE
jgi:hypothetical protein